MKVKSVEGVTWEGPGKNSNRNDCGLVTWGRQSRVSASACVAQGVITLRTFLFDGRHGDSRVLCCAWWSLQKKKVRVKV